MPDACYDFLMTHGPGWAMKPLKRLMDRFMPNLGFPGMGVDGVKRDPRIVGPFSDYDNITKGKGTKNLKTNVDLDSFKRELEQSGYKPEITSHPDVMRHVKDGNGYVTRPFSKEGSATAEFYKDDSLKFKIRLGN